MTAGIIAEVFYELTEGVCPEDINHSILTLISSMSLLFKAYMGIEGTVSLIVTRLE
ncbi:MAG TPA: hypothetical protein VM050_09730 [Patescibacteria group bacterium]|nr:hypothetical protein [Patescibacteria group bacterium]